jgi:two-component SAPR family response regulator
LTTTIQFAGYSKGAGQGRDGRDSFDSGTKLQALQKEEPPIISDIHAGNRRLELLEQIGNSYPKLPVIIMTAHSDLAAVSAQGGLNICPNRLMSMMP